MVSFLSNWAKGIVSIVIICNFLEIILPSGAGKKYIKIATGLVLVYTIISPLAGFCFNNKDINFNLDNTIEASSYEVDRKVGSTTEEVKKIYVDNLQKDVEQKLNQEGYVAESVKIDVEGGDSYNLRGISIKIQEKINKEEGKKHLVSIVENIKKIKINSNVKEEKSVVNKTDIENIKKIISDSYGISQQLIYVN